VRNDFLGASDQVREEMKAYLNEKENVSMTAKILGKQDLEGELKLEKYRGTFRNFCLGMRVNFGVPERCLTQLKKLELICCKIVVGEDCAFIGKHCPNLEILNLQAGMSITATGFQVMIANLHKLKWLSIDFCTGVNDACLQEIGKSCPELEYLSTAGCPSLTDPGLKAVTVGCPKLRHLCVASSYQLTSQALQAVMDNCPLIESLSIEGCFSITEPFVSKIPTVWPNLKSLSVFGCYTVVLPTLKDIVTKCKHLEYLKISQKEWNGDLMNEVTKQDPARTLKIDHELLNNGHLWSDTRASLAETYLFAEFM